MSVAIADLKLHTLHVVYPGSQRYKLSEKIEALPLQDLLAEIESLRARKTSRKPRATRR